MALQGKITYEIRSKATIGVRLGSKMRCYARRAIKRVLYVVRYAYHSIRARVADLG